MDSASAPRFRVLNAGMLAALWWLIASAQIDKHIGASATLATLPAIVLIAAGAAIAFRRNRAPQPANAHYGQWLAAAAAVALFALPAALTSLAHNDEVASLDHAIAVLFAGQNPYGHPLQPSRPLMELPGSLILAAPFHWAASVAWQNPFWAALFASWLVARARDGRGVGVRLAVLALNPAILRSYVTGSDNLADAIILLLAIEFTRTAHDRREVAGAVTAALCVALALCTHPAFGLLIPVTLRCVGAAAGRGAALRFAGILVAAMLALCLPFYVSNPAQFGLVTLLAYVSTLPPFLWTFPAAALAYALFGPTPRDDPATTAGIVFAIALVPPLLFAMIEGGFSDYAVLAAPVLLFLIAGRPRIPARPGMVIPASFSLPPNH